MFLFMLCYVRNKYPKDLWCAFAAGDTNDVDLSIIIVILSSYFMPYQGHIPNYY